MTKAVTDVLDEVLRQREVEGWTTAHDDAHDPGTLAKAATTYAWSAIGELAESFRGPRMDADTASRRFGWPWDAKWWKPKGPRRDLVRAAALLIAEIERMDRAETSICATEEYARVRSLDDDQAHSLMPQ